VNKQKTASENFDLVILSPYNAQRDRIKQALVNTTFEEFKSKDLERNVFSVDSFQGKQADIVIVSLVRNNEFSSPRASLGFLVQEERLNVMLSRVRKRLIVIGCSKLIERFKSEREDRAIIDVWNYFQSNGKIIKMDELREN